MQLGFNRAEGTLRRYAGNHMTTMNTGLVEVEASSGEQQPLSSALAVIADEFQPTGDVSERDRDAYRVRAMEGCLDYIASIYQPSDTEISHGAPDPWLLDAVDELVNLFPDLRGKEAEEWLRANGPPSDSSDEELSTAKLFAELEWRENILYRLETRTHSKHGTNTETLTARQLDSTPEATEETPDVESLFGEIDPRTLAHAALAAGTPDPDTAPRKVGLFARVKQRFAAGSKISAFFQSDARITEKFGLKERTISDEKLAMVIQTFSPERRARIEHLKSEKANPAAKDAYNQEVAKIKKMHGKLEYTRRGKIVFGAGIGALAAAGAILFMIKSNQDADKHDKNRATPVVSIESVDYSQTTSEIEPQATASNLGSIALRTMPNNIDTNKLVFADNDNFKTFAQAVDTLRLENPHLDETQLEKLAIDILDLAASTTPG